jgi:hypothetical protein
MQHFEDNMIFKAGKAKKLCDCNTNTELWVELLTPDSSYDNEDFIMSTATFYKEVISEEDYESSFEEVGEMKFFQSNTELSAEELFELFDPESNDLSVVASLFNQDLEYGDIYLHSLIINKEYRGQGFGSEIINWLVSYKDPTDLVFFQTVLKEEEQLKSFYKKAFKKFSLNRENENMLVFTRN